jgi:hypothetical protein
MSREVSFALDGLPGRVAESDLGEVFAACPCGGALEVRVRSDETLSVVCLRPTCGASWRVSASGRIEPTRAEGGWRTFASAFVAAPCARKRKATRVVRSNVLPVSSPDGSLWASAGSLVELASEINGRRAA